MNMKIPVNPIKKFHKSVEVRPVEAPHSWEAKCRDWDTAICPYAYIYIHTYMCACFEWNVLRPRIFNHLAMLRLFTAPKCLIIFRTSFCSAKHCCWHFCRRAATICAILHNLLHTRMHACKYILYCQRSFLSTIASLVSLS